MFFGKFDQEWLRAGSADHSERKNKDDDNKADSPIDSPNSIRISIETVDKILSLIKDNSSITTEELAKETGKSVRTIKKGLQILREEGKIKRVDSPTVGGRWEVTDSQKQQYS